MAFLGIFLARQLDIPELDGVASTLIGVILASTAALLAHESKGLLIGESASPALVAGTSRIVGGETGVVRVNELLTMRLGPLDVLVNLSLDFADGMSSSEVEASISEIERQVKTTHPEVSRVFIEAQSW